VGAREVTGTVVVGGVVLVGESGGAGIDVAGVEDVAAEPDVDSAVARPAEVHALQTRATIASNCRPRVTP